ncbi:MerR family transcriptional regulator [Gemmobacter aquarius]|uniref:MerR family transcriptional regulator n=1 Tax=Paragemmobacter aquarius TaxID=2169400 RepID=A0A2S0UKY4_9RHOB|nr:MerR family transcriptional regulator [Gemmobacter aquarius]AWB48455.1 MerR family transcriptional regulator [Gemmobacter aquarius]
MEKSADAFRTISEVAEQLDTPAHVLRFWESRFPQVRPVKRAGGRRYYRPADVALLAGIKRLLHDEGVTIRGVQKILREQGVRHVATLGGLTALPQPEADIEAVLARALGPATDPEPVAEVAEVQTAQVISLEAALARAEGRSAQIPLDLGAVEEDAPEAPFVEADEAPLPEPVMLHGPDRGAIAGQDAPREDDGSTAAGNTASDRYDESGDDTADESPDEPGHTLESHGESSVMMRLRMVAPQDVAHRSAELAALRERMLDLRARLAKGVRRRSR